MNKSNIQTIIWDLATENFDLYPESYPIENGVATGEALENLQSLAVGYFECRTELEVHRDAVYNLSESDYIEFVRGAFAAWAQGSIITL